MCESRGDGEQWPSGPSLCSGSFHFRQGDVEEGAAGNLVWTRSCSHQLGSGLVGHLGCCPVLTTQPSPELRDRDIDPRQSQPGTRDVSSDAGRTHCSVPSAYLRYPWAAGGPQRLPNSCCLGALDNELVFYSGFAPPLIRNYL